MGFIRNLWIFPLLAIHLLHGDLVDHLKKIENKTDGHSIRNIDFIYMINLDQRPEKCKATLDQLAPYEIFPYRFSAVNGWELTLEEINDVGLKFSPEMEGGFMATSYLPDGDFKPHHEMIQHYEQTYFCHCLSRGAIGIALSHISILQDAFDSGYETIWVIEDDIEVISHPHILSDLIERLDELVGKENWDILFTDKDIRDRHGNHKPSFWAAKRPDFIHFSRANNYMMKKQVGDEFCQIGSRWGAHSMIIRKSGMKKLLQFFKAHQLYLPYDMDYILPPGIKLFNVLTDVVSNSPHAVSDNGGPNYK